MPNTPKGLTYPSNASPVAVPADIQELATDVDNIIVPISGGTYSGAVAFLQNPSVPTPTSALHAVNKTYADSINADVTALENELGTNPSGTFSTVKDRLDSYTDGFDQIGNVLSTASASCSGDWTIDNVTPSYNTPTGSVTLAAGWTYAVPNVKIVGSVNFMSPIALPNELWTAQVQISSTGGSAYVLLLFADASGNTLSQLIGNYIGAGTSGLSRAVGVAPSGTVEVALAVYNSNGSTAVVLSQPTLHRGVGGLFAMPGKLISGQSNVLINNAVHLSGTGAPESVVTAAPGSTWLQTGDAVTVSGNLLWRKATGTGNTGWTPEGALADTGWRNVSAGNRGSNWTAGTVHIRRIGNSVRMRAYGLTGAATFGPFWTVPAGWDKDWGFQSVHGIGRENASTGAPYWFANHGQYGGLISGGAWSASHSIAPYAEWLTSDPWPTSLPGSAV